MNSRTKNRLLFELATASRVYRDAVWLEKSLQFADTVEKLVSLSIATAKAEAARNLLISLEATVLAYGDHPTEGAQ